MRFAAFLVALFTILVGVAGIVSPEYLTMARRAYFAAPVTLYAAAALRVVMGLIVMRVARISRAPRTILLLGVLMTLQGLTAAVLGPAHARTVLEWETAQGPAMLRAGAGVALLAGIFMLFAFTGPGARDVHSRG
jgi:hypothetical protein